MEKVLLLSCATGQGHNACASAIKEYFEARNVTCELLDALDFISKHFAGLVSWGHSFMYRYLPWMFRQGYAFSEAHSSVFWEGSAIYRILTSGADSLYQYITAGQFDTVICTHMFAAIILTHCGEEHPLSVRTAFVATDYTCYPGLEVCRLDRYFIADDSLVGHFIQSGVSSAAIMSSGIPVHQSFWWYIDKASAKKRLGIAPSHKHLLVMGGSMGAGPMLKLLKSISRLLEHDTEVSVLCGTNWELRQCLALQYREENRIHVRGYTDQVPLYLSSADLYLTKPGGISITEAAAKCVPMVFVNAVAGCELYNMDYFLNLGAAVSADSPTELAERTMRLLCDPAERDQMEAALRAYRQTNGAARIFQELNKNVCSERCEYSGLSPVQVSQAEYAGV